MAAESRELTFRGVCLGGVVTIVFIAANAYLGLKTGITFSSSIPAAVMSMGLFKLVGGSGPLENSIVQTQASAAGTLCNVNLVLPGLVLIHYWQNFPVGQTIAICSLGGLLGLAFSVPLRRAMVIGSDLPFPEGVAAAEVLASAGSDQGNGVRELGLATAVAGSFSFMTGATGLLPDRIGGVVTAGHATFRLDGGLSLALIGIGYLVRIGCCAALLIGLLLAWGVAVPILTSFTHSSSDPVAAAQMVWSQKVRLIGAGLIAAAGLWTVARLIKPVWLAIAASLHKTDAGGKDIPIMWIGVMIVVLNLAMAGLLYNFLGPSASLGFVLGLTAFTSFVAFAMATACGYLAGLLGSSSSPISGIGILTIMITAGAALVVLPAADSHFAGALALFVTSLIVTASSIANDNLQDLKSGAILGATPWKQQVALAIGVIFGALTLGVLLPVLYAAYGLTGALPHPGMDAGRALAAPQAALLAQVADGLVSHRLDWMMVSIGATLGAAFVGLESWLGRRQFTLPALSVGIGMYLPAAVVLTIAIGGVIGWLAEKSAPALASVELRRRGVLIASGFLVGECLVGILTAFADIATGKSGALTLSHAAPSTLRTSIAVTAFGALLGLFYRLVASPQMKD